MHGPRLASEALTRDLEGSRTLNAYSTRELLTRLEASTPAAESVRRRRYRHDGAHAQCDHQKAADGLAAG
jgi:hypothetical protein